MFGNNYKKNYLNKYKIFISENLNLIHSITNLIPSTEVVTVIKF